MTVLEVLKRSTQWLEKRGLERPRLDVELLMAHVLGVARLDLYLQFDRPLAEPELDRIRELVVQRGDDVPVAYLLGQWEFFSLTFEVDERVLVPRPETEQLVECALAHLRPHEAPVFADVGTGSGCVAVALLHELPGARAYATDTSPGALEVARKNAERHEVAERLTLLEGHLLDPVRAAARQPLHAVVSNPPYVVRGDPQLESGVRKHEPEAALYVSGDDALEHVRALAQDAREILESGGLLAVEVGYGSGPAAREVLTAAGYLEVGVIDDLGGVPRIVRGTAP